MNGIALRFLKLVARGLYLCLKVLPTQRKIVLISRLSTTPSIDFRVLQAHLEINQPQHRVVMLNHKMENKLQHALHVVQEMYHLATAQACVVESYVIAVSLFKHKRSLTIIQMWHALGALKQFGHQIIGRPEGSRADIARTMHMHENYTYVLAGSDTTAPTFAAAFDVPESSIRPIGMPRIDYLLTANARENATRELSDIWPELSSKPVVIYAPTFRKGRAPKFDELFEKFCFETHNLLIACHQRDAIRAADLPDGAFVSPSGRVVEFLPLADALITDYSATAFEAAVLRVPTYFWVHDLERYLDRRGLNLEFTSENLGGSPVSTRLDDIITALSAGTHDAAAWADFAARYVAVQDGTSTEKLVALMELTA